MQTKLKFELGQRAVIVISGEKGQVIARCDYLESTPSYCLRYVAKDGRAVESWWSAEALDALEIVA